MFVIGPDMTAYLLIYDYLIRENSTDARSRMLLEALSASEGLYLPLKTVSLDEQRRENINSSSPPLLDEHSWTKAKKLCVTRLQKAAEEGRLLGTKLVYYLDRWKGLSEDNAPRRYVKSLTSTLEKTLMFLRCVTEEIRSITSGSVLEHSTPKLDIAFVEQFVPLSRLMSRLKPLLSDEIPSEYSEIAAEYKKELDVFKMALDPGSRDPFDEGHAEGAAPIDINSASLEDLMELPGIDSELAQRIIDNRPYQTVDGIKSVKGIGRVRLSKLRGRIRT